MLLKFQGKSKLITIGREKNLEDLKKIIAEKCKLSDLQCGIQYQCPAFNNEFVELEDINQLPDPATIQLSCKGWPRKFSEISMVFQNVLCPDTFCFTVGIWWNYDNLLIVEEILVEYQDSRYLMTVGSEMLMDALYSLIQSKLCLKSLPQLKYFHPHFQQLVELESVQQLQAQSKIVVKV